MTRAEELAKKMFDLTVERAVSVHGIPPETVDRMGSVFDALPSSVKSDMVAMAELARKELTDTAALDEQVARALADQFSREALEALEAMETRGVPIPGYDEAPDYVKDTWKRLAATARVILRG
jgi:hypothetical protein